MSTFLIAQPEALAAATEDLNGIGEAIRGAAAAAAPSTTGIVPAGADAVSGAIAGFFGGYAQDFRALHAQTAEFHARFVQSLGSGGAAPVAQAPAATREPGALQATVPPAPRAAPAAAEVAAAAADPVPRRSRRP
ncbi:MAG: hypothetical protein QOH91_2167 [Mycobacterium sp.]|jgi:hypothetical protein|nr:hypothetical protein [Mycobacterium sp.]